MNMKFMGILLNEGRKEDLKKKYSTKFNEEDLDFILNISDLADFNHKYTDFVLKNTDGDGELDTNELEHLVGLIQDFDKYQSQFPKKDINQYVSVNELESVINHARTKKKEKEEESKIDKVYEDDKFVVVKPNTEAASCKYGSKTKWCVTARGTGHFDRYTSGNQGLYFIINKTNSTNQNYSKIAIHFRDNDINYWDSQDQMMTDREIQILKYAYPELIEAIESDYQEFSKNNKNKLLNEIFNDIGLTVIKQKNFLGTESIAQVSVTGFNISSSNKSNGIINISIDEKLIDSYKFTITFEPEDNKSFSASIILKRNEGPTDLGLEDWGFESQYLISGQPKIIAEGVRNHIASRVMDDLKGNIRLQQKLIGSGRVWRPDRFNYGYTFGKNKGLITKLVSYLDSKDIGTKLDFLESIGKLKSKKVDGKKLYAHSYSDKYFPSSQWRGHFSSFFASAKLAGILGYRKIGKDYFLIKGPNFDAFKSGQLKSL